VRVRRFLRRLAVDPLLMGFLADIYGLPFAMSVVPLFCLIAAALFVIAAAITYESDLKSVEGIESPHLEALKPQLAGS
jgi:ribulose kinase